MRILDLVRNTKVEEVLRRIVANELPSDRLYGMVELQTLGYDVTVKCIRPKGKIGQMLEVINNKFNLNLCGYSTLVNLTKYDVIIVHGQFSTLVTIFCKLLRKKIVYLDSLFVPPNSVLRKLLIKINIILSDGTIVNTRAQLEDCSRIYNVPMQYFKFIPFGIDSKFCKNKVIDNDVENVEPYVLSVGRDAARDYQTLVSAMKGVNVKLKLVTLPYLLNGVDLACNNIEILDGLSYEELYKLYVNSLFVVIPLKKWGTAHSSGITSLLEAKTFSKSVIASNSKPLRSYLEQGEGVVYVEPENVVELHKAIVELLGDHNQRARLSHVGHDLVVDQFNMDRFARVFGDYLVTLIL